MKKVSCKLRVLLLAILLVTVSFVQQSSFNAHAASGADVPEYVGQVEGGFSGFNAPTGAVVSPDGTKLYVTNNNGEVPVIGTSDSSYVGMARQRTNLGSVFAPSISASAVSPDGTKLYVTDYYNDYVEVLSTITYEKLSQFGTNGSGNGQFNRPQGVAVSSDGSKLYVADRNNNRIQIFNTSDNSFIGKFGTNGSGNGQFNQPAGLAVTSDGSKLYVADRGNNRIQIFNTSDNSFVSKWGSQGSGDNQFSSPYDIDLSHDGSKLYVADRGNNRIQIFNTSDNTHNHSLENAEIATAVSTDSITLNPVSGKLYMGNGLVFDDQTGYLETISTIYDGEGGLAFSPDGSRLYVAGGEGVSVLDTADYSVLSRQEASWGSADGEFGSLFGVTLSPDGSKMYLVDSYNNRIQIFNTNDSSFVSSFGSLGTNDGQFEFPYGITTDSTGNIYVVDPVSSRIQKFDANGNFLSKWGSQGSGDGQFNGPSKIAVDPSGNIYIADAQNYRIQKFDANGNFLSKWGSQGSGDGQFQNSIGLTLSPDGNAIYVADPINNRIQTFRYPSSEISESVATFQSPETNQPISLQTPSGTTITCSFASKESTAAKQDESYQYPLGLVNFCFDTENENNEVSLTFVTDLKPSEVKARKYNSTNQTYFDIPDSTITETTYEGQHALGVSYAITDNGLLDLDPMAGKIVDPVGLAVVPDHLATENESSVSFVNPTLSETLAQTGQSQEMLYLLLVTGVLLVGGSMFVRRRL